MIPNPTSTLVYVRPPTMIPPGTCLRHCHYGITAIVKAVTEGTSTDEDASAMRRAFFSRWRFSKRLKQQYTTQNPKLSSKLLVLGSSKTVGVGFPIGFVLDSVGLGVSSTTRLLLRRSMLRGSGG